jgi:nicotinate-nucleotide--dimethylbenzimidazole phosphoribosyltransferase
MVGALPGEATKQEKLVRFGYAKIKPKKNSMLFTAGDDVAIHEFHYWDSTENGSDLKVVKTTKNQSWLSSYVNDHFYAGFPHIYLDAGKAEFFVQAAMTYRSQKKWDSLAKPLRSLGRMEELINQVAGITKSTDVTFSKPRLYVVCGDNGIIEEGVSQSDASVTAEVAYSLAKGESTVCHLAKPVNCEVIPVNAGMACYEPTEGVWEYSLGKGTKNFRWEVAMDWNQMLRAFSNGEELVRRAVEDGCDVLLLGEMGIGNTTTSSAIASVLLEMQPKEVTGRGAGLSDEGLKCKIAVIEEALARHGHALTNPMDTLMFLGGFDIATLVGILFGAETYHMPVILDGFITDVAALLAVRMNPDVRRILLPSHLSMEPACVRIYEELEMEPLITADMHLGEGSGAVMALGLFQIALQVYNSGHTFGELGIDAYTLQN